MSELPSTYRMQHGDDSPAGQAHSASGGPAPVLVRHARICPSGSVAGELTLIARVSLALSRTGNHLPKSAHTGIMGITTAHTEPAARDSEWSRGGFSWCAVQGEYPQLLAGGAYRARQYMQRTGKGGRLGPPPTDMTRGSAR